MFDSPVLDRLTRVHPAVPAVLFVPIVIALLAVALRRMDDPLAIAAAIGGYVTWTLTEYWLHRVVFHFEPEKGFGARLHWMLHGVHHDHPNDPKRLVMPPSASIPLAAAFAGLFVLTLGTPLAFGVLSGFLGGYVAYDSVHYWLHHSTPRGRVGKRLRELHMRHHFQDDTTAFGVSAPYWDRVFGTAPGRERGGH